MQSGKEKSIKLIGHAKARISAPARFLSCENYHQKACKNAWNKHISNFFFVSAHISNLNWHQIHKDRKKALGQKTSTGPKKLASTGLHGLCDLTFLQSLFRVHHCIALLKTFSAGNSCNDYFQKLAAERSVHSTFCAEDIQVIEEVQLWFKNHRIASVTSGEVKGTLIVLLEALDVCKILARQFLWKRNFSWKICKVRAPNNNINRIQDSIKRSEDQQGMAFWEPIWFQF